MDKRKISYRLLGPFIAAVAAMAAVLFVLLYVWAAHADAESRSRDETLVANSIQVAFRRTEQELAPLATWDEAVRRLDNQFDAKWAEAYLASEPATGQGSRLTFILGGDGKVLFASLDGKRKTPAEVAAFARAAGPLVDIVRRSEAQRGSFIGRSASGDAIAYPIQSSAAKTIDGGVYALTTTLVQPSFGAVLPKGERAPVVVTGSPIDQTYLQLLSDRYLLSDLHLEPGDAGLPAQMARYRIEDEGGRPVATLEWTPTRPGTTFLYRAIGPVSVLVLILAAGLFVVMEHSDAVSRSLALSESRLQLAMSAAKAGAFEMDYANRTFWCSPEMVEIIGRKLTDEEAFRSPWPVTHPDDAAPCLARVNHWMKSDQARHTDEMRIVRPDGEVRWVKLALTRSRDPAAISRITGLLQDIDEGKRQELALVEAKRAAQAAADAKSAFLASMSHEIRTPMNGILGVLHLLADEPLSEDGGQLVSEALACGQMLTTLIDDVLDFSKIEAGQMELNPVPADPAIAIDGVAKLLRPQCEAKGVRLEVIVPADLGWVSIDPMRLRQALFNLVGNAVKFTLAGSVQVRLSRVGGGRVRFEVIDTGIGIPDHAQDQLFEQFQQGDSSTTRRFGGTGLGLAITRRLARLMGGDVGFESLAGVGSTFWLEVAAPEAQSPAAAPTEAAAVQALRVLVVEDNPMNRLVATRLLESMGMIAETADDGEAGVIAAAGGRYDLILMDVQMPGMDGLEATRRIRAMGGPVSATPIVALTANAMTHQRDSYLAAGMDGLVAKPISPSALLAEITRLATGPAPGTDIALAS